MKGYFDRIQLLDIDEYYIDINNKKYLFTQQYMNKQMRQVLQTVEQDRYCFAKQTFKLGYLPVCEEDVLEMIEEMRQEVYIRYV